jgi:mRNA interferase MazF
VKRGAVYLVSQGTGQGHGNTVGSAEAARTVLRPAVLVSRDAINRHSAVVLVCPLVDAAGVRQRYPSDVAVSAPEGGLTVDSVILTGQLRAIPREGLVRYLGELSRELMQEVDKALRITLDLES